MKRTQSLKRRRLEQEEQGAHAHRTPFQPVVDENGQRHCKQCFQVERDEDELEWIECPTCHYSLHRRCAVVDSTCDVYACHNCIFQK